MSIRPVKQVIHATPHIEGAGVKLQRAFGFGNTTEFDPFLLFDDFRTRTRTTIVPVSRGIRTAGSRRSPTCSPVTWTMATASETAAASAPATSSG
jgi:hypothetical protein